MRKSATTIASIMFGAMISSAGAATVPFTEEFVADSANWRNATGGAALGWSATGGPDGAGDSYAFGGFNFVDSVMGDTPALLRGQAGFGSSGGAFVGDYIAEGVMSLSYTVRHDAPVPLGFFTRIATPGNFPAVAALEFVPVLPNVWTVITVLVTDPNPTFVYEGPFSTFTSVFGNVGNIQVGVMVPESLAGLDATFTFDLDKVNIVPAPGSAAIALAFCAVSAMRRRRS